MSGGHWCCRNRWFWISAFYGPGEGPLNMKGHGRLGKAARWAGFVLEWAARRFFWLSWQGFKWCAIALFLHFWMWVCGVKFAEAADISIPRAAYSYKSLLIRSGHAFWGLDAPAATFAAQIHAESLWRPEAVSWAGAEGMAQFMPATAKWISGAYAHLADNEPRNPAWAARALVTYDKHLWERVTAVDDCQRMAKALSAYNGGLGWVRRDEDLARRQGFEPGLFFGGVDQVNAGRKASAKKENREYPAKILLRFEPAYELAGFGRGMCP